MQRKVNLWKLFSIIMVFALLVSMATPSVFADSDSAKKITILVNGEKIEPEVPAQIIESRTMVPLRFIAEALGNTVEWDAKKRAALVDSSSISDAAVPEAASEDDPIRIYVAGMELNPEVPAQIIEGRTMVPLRFIAEALGAEVGWDGKTYTVTINKTEEKYGYKRVIKKEGKAVVSLEPDELYIATSWNRAYQEGVPSETVDKLLGQYIKKYFPDVKFKIYDWDVANEEDWATSGVYPDIYLDEPERDTIRHIRKYGMEYDLTPLIEKYNVDLDRLNKSAMSIIRDRGAGKIYSLPLEISDYILYYNKTLFDKRGVDYPTEGMTYDEAFELAQEMTFQDGFNQIKGWSQHPDQYLVSNQLGLSFFSQTERDKVSITSDEWVYLVNNLRRFYQIPGNLWNSTTDFSYYSVAAVAVDSTERMYYLAPVKEYIQPDDAEWWTNNKDYNQNGTFSVPSKWDITSIPVFPEAPDTIYSADALSMFVTKQSQMKETAFKIVNMFLRDDVQKARAADGIKGVVKTEEIANAFGTNVPEYKDLNLKAVYWGENAVQPVRPPEIAGGGYWDIATWAVFRKYIFQYGLSTEMALQRVEMEENQWIQDRIAEGWEFY